MGSVWSDETIFNKNVLTADSIAAPKRVKAAGDRIAGSSNIVSSSNSNVITFAESITILSLEKERKITLAQQILHMYTEIMPAMTSYKQVNWSIEPGVELVTISASGLLAYTGGGNNGTVRIKATTVDGSNLSATADINVSGFVQEEKIKVSSITVRAESTSLTLANRTTMVTATVLPANATDKRVTWSVTSGSTVASVTVDGLVTALGVNGTAIIRATADDGSGVYGETTIIVSGFGSGIDETKSGNISVYPVPVRDILYIETSDVIVRTEIISIDGRIVRLSEGDVDSIRVVGMPAGVYTLRIEMEGNRMKLLRFIVE